MSMLSRHSHGGYKDRYYAADQDPFHDYRDRSDAIVKQSSGVETHNHIDWKETSDAHVFKLEFPGVKKSDIKVEVEDDDRVLCITGEKIMEREHSAGMWHRVERSCGKIIRRISLPEDADAERVAADMSGGVLTITVPKRHHRRTSCARSVMVTGY